MNNRQLFILSALSFFLLGSGPILKVQWTDNRLSVHADNVPLGAVFEAVLLKKRAALIFEGRPEDPERVISKYFIDLTMEEGLNRLLSPWDYLLVRAVPSGIIKKVFVVSSQSNYMKQRRQVISNTHGPLYSRHSPETISKFFKRQVTPSIDSTVLYVDSQNKALPIKRKLAIKQGVE